MYEVYLSTQSQMLKSRLGLTYLADKNINLEVIDYIKDGLDMELLEQVSKALSLFPTEFIRKKEAKELGVLNEEYSFEEWLQIIIDHPRLLERPILMGENKAVIGRPAENFDQII